jgi:hypothetical protein
VAPPVRAAVMQGPCGTLKRGRRHGAALRVVRRLPSYLNG